MNDINRLSLLFVELMQPKLAKFFSMKTYINPENFVRIEQANRPFYGQLYWLIRNFQDLGAVNPQP